MLLAGLHVHECVGTDVFFIAAPVLLAMQAKNVQYTAFVKYFIQRPMVCVVLPEMSWDCWAASETVMPLLYYRCSAWARFYSLVCMYFGGQLYIINVFTLNIEYCRFMDIRI